MSNGTEHRVSAAVALFCAAAADWKEDDHWSKHPVVAAGAGAACGTLPDILEPAVHPGHRQFFHSLAFVGLVGYGLHRVYRWEPQDFKQRIVRSLVLIAGTAYLVHLVLDANTPKGLPLLGKL